MEHGLTDELIAPYTDRLRDSLMDISRDLLTRGPSCICLYRVVYRGSL
jgi:hypothetical protein